MRKPLRAPLGLARFALHLHRRHAAAGLRCPAAWGLLLAYLATGASVAGGALYYAGVLWQQFLPWTHWTPPALPTLAVVCVIAAWVAYRDVKLSAELMLWIEAISVGLILIVLAVMFFHFGLKLDLDQLRLKGVSVSQRSGPHSCWPCSPL